MMIEYDDWRWKKIIEDNVDAWWQLNDGDDDQWWLKMMQILDDEDYSH